MRDLHVVNSNRFEKVMISTGFAYRVNGASVSEDYYNHRLAEEMAKVKVEEDAI